MSNTTELGRKLNETFEPGVVTAPDPGAAGAQGGAKAEQFPRKFTRKDRFDDVMQMRSQISDPEGQTPFGDLEYTDEVGRWLIRKQKIAEDAEFDAWFGRNYDVNDLAGRQFAQQVNPEYYNERERQILARAHEAARLKIIQLRGPKTEEELKKVWLINTGRVKLPEDWDRIGPSHNFAQDTAKKNLKANMFSLPLFTDKAFRDASVAVPGNPFGSATATGNVFPVQGNADIKPFSRAPGSLSRKFLADYTDL